MLQTKELGYTGDEEEERKLRDVTSREGAATHRPTISSQNAVTQRDSTQLDLYQLKTQPN